MTLTDEEKREMRGVDEHARRILERTESLPDGDLLKLHGVMRPGTSMAAEVAVDIAGEEAGEAFFNPSTRVKTVIVMGVGTARGATWCACGRSRARTRWTWRWPGAWR